MRVYLINTNLYLTYYKRGGVMTRLKSAKDLHKFVVDILTLTQHTIPNKRWNKVRSKGRNVHISIMDLKCRANHNK